MVTHHRISGNINSEDIGQFQLAMFEILTGEYILATQKRAAYTTRNTMVIRGGIKRYQWLPLFYHSAALSWLFACDYKLGKLVSIDFMSVRNYSTESYQQGSMISAKAGANFNAIWQSLAPSSRIKDIRHPGACWINNFHINCFCGCLCLWVRWWWIF